MADEVASTQAMKKCGEFFLESSFQPLESELKIVLRERNSSGKAIDENTAIKNTSQQEMKIEITNYMTDGEALQTEVPMLSDWKPTDS